MKYKDNIVTIDSFQIEFSHKIKQVEQVGDAYLILLSIPAKDASLNNIYAISNCGEILWQVEENIYSGKINLPYEQLLINNNEIKATDFYGRRIYIDKLTGKILKHDFVK